MTLLLGPSATGVDCMCVTVRTGHGHLTLEALSHGVSYHEGLLLLRTGAGHLDLTGARDCILRSSLPLGPGTCQHLLSRFLWDPCEDDLLALGLTMPATQRELRLLQHQLTLLVRVRELRKGRVLLAAERLLYHVELRLTDGLLHRHRLTGHTLLSSLMLT